MSIRDRVGSAQVGEELFTAKVAIGREDLVRYAGAAGDFNAIHYNDAAAKAAGLPSVIAHGMLSMGIVSRIAVEWAGDARALLRFGGRFTSMLPVPDPPEHVDVDVTGTLKEVAEGSVTVALTIAAGDKEYITGAEAVFSLA